MTYLTMPWHSMPDSWWTTYTRALINSRGGKHWIDAMLERQQLLNDAWLAVHENLKPRGASR
jgi:hypothetical protein